MPAGTRLAAGADGLDREVARPAVLRTRAPAFESLLGGELALASLDAIRLVDERLTLGVLIERLAEKRAAALAVVGESDGAALAKADEARLPLLWLPPSVSLYDLEQSIARVVFERRSQLYQQGMEVHRQLVELSIGGRGLPAIVQRLAEMTGRIVVLQSGAFRVEHFAAAPGLPFAQADALAALPDSSALLRMLKGQPLLAANPPVLRLPDGPLGALVAPVFAQESVAGYLYLLAPADDLDDADRVAVARASVVCSLELAKQRAVVEAEQRLRGDFLEDLLEDRVSEEALISRARHLGYDLRQPHSVLILRPEPAADPERVAELARVASRYLAGRKLKAPVITREQGVVVLCPLADPPDLRPARELARDILGRLGEPERASAGIGRYRPGVAGLRAAYHEAERALAIGRHLFGAGQATCFADLGTYRLLYALKDNPDLADFCRETLGALIEYDARNGTELVRTLDAYFAHRANLQATADALFLHRNSLAYRLRRVEEVAGVNLDDFEDRFRLQLALKARQVLAQGQ